MKYLKRSVGYFLRLVVLLLIVLGIMALTGTLNLESGNVFQVLFHSRNGLILLGLMVGLSAVYPKISFTTVTVDVVMDNNTDIITDAFASLGYTMTEAGNKRLVFRATSPLRRMLMQWDDAVTVTSSAARTEMEGLKKIVTRVELRIIAAKQK